MATVPNLSKLSDAEKDALILSLTAHLTVAQERITALEARITTLEARLEELTRPPKTPDNSSKPPLQDQKPDRLPPGTDRPPRNSRPGVGRRLPPNPDRVVEAKLATCPNCEAAFPDASQSPQQV